MKKWRQSVVVVRLYFRSQTYEKREIDMGYRGPKTGQGGRPLSSRLGPKTRISIPTSLVPVISELIYLLEHSTYYYPDTWDFTVNIEKKKTKSQKVKQPHGKGFNRKKNR